MTNKQRTLDNITTERKAIISSLRVLKGRKTDTIPKIMRGNEKKAIIILLPKALILYQFSSEVKDFGILSPYVLFIGTLPRINGIAIPIIAIPIITLRLLTNKRRDITSSEAWIGGIASVKIV